MVTVKVFTATDLDFDAHSALLRAAFQDLLSRAGMSTASMTPVYYQWKYRPPAGEARIAAVFKNGRMVAANSMIPLILRFGHLLYRTWQSCDTATHPEARGQGHFTRCLRSLQETIDPAEIFFGFPNQASTAGFKKIGWEKKQEIPTWLGLSALAVESQKTHSVSAFDSRMDAVWKRSFLWDRPGLDRPAAYLNWRYAENPCFRYSCFVCPDQLEFGFLVLRLTEHRGIRIGLIMELWATTPRLAVKLSGQARYWARRNRAPLVMALDNGRSLLGAMGSLFFPVPPFVLPKRQIIMGCTVDTRSQTIFDLPWKVQLGDWDGF
jgi:hypothetical protein